jgi:hypothetical protein
VDDDEMLIFMSRKRVVSSSANRWRRTTAVSSALIRQTGADMREFWTEADVLALPSEESDSLERKSGRLFEKDKNGFRDALAKAASAFANSGGGTLILGVEDDGSLTGINPMVGKTALKDWLEQKLPSLLAYPLTLFRVHTVVPAEPSKIPENTVIIVIEFGDSPAAPHQSTVDQKYYQRTGGRSEPAHHFYLELLRQRLTNPSLEFSLDDLVPTHVELHDGTLYLETKLSFMLKNIGNVAAYKWELAFRTLGNTCLNESDDLNARIFPFFRGLPYERSRPSTMRLDDTILPGCATKHDMAIAFRLGSIDANEDQVREAVACVICAMTFGMQLATETSPGEMQEVALKQACDADAITQFIVEADPWGRAAA